MDQGTRIRYEKHRRRSSAWYALFIGMILGALAIAFVEASQTDDAVTKLEDVFAVVVVISLIGLFVGSLIQGSHNEGAAKAIEKEFGSPDAIFLGEEGDGLRPGDEQ